jgi:glc operon protein GlcG
MQIAKKVLGLALVGALALAGAASAQLIDKKTISLAAAKKIAGGGEAEAAKNNWKMVIAIVDDGGHLVYLQRGDDTQIGSIDIAIGKAHTALALRRSTKAVEDIIAGGRTAFLGVRGLTPIQGGLPIIVDGKVVGAVGASGGTSPQDEQVAKAGIDAMMK